MFCWGFVIWDEGRAAMRRDLRELIIQGIADLRRSSAFHPRSPTFRPAMGGETGFDPLGPGLNEDALRLLDPRDCPRFKGWQRLCPILAGHCLSATRRRMIALPSRRINAS